jgi:EAL domain-containing protein (putative c-di-GMP-specific phosphodiesterase class I)
VDDMGAGYSGLRQITTVHPSYLKLDRSLISGIDHDPDRAALVGALVGYSNQVGSLLVGEGIEHSAELRVLDELGVPLVQGFYTGRPAQPWPQGGIARSPVASGSAPIADPAALDTTPVPSAAAGSLMPA